MSTNLLSAQLTNQLHAHAALTSFGLYSGEVTQLIFSNENDLQDMWERETTPCCNTSLNWERNGHAWCGTCGNWCR
jgi:hypothetical protein